MSGDAASQVARSGHALVEAVADVATIASLKTALAGADMARAERQGETYGARNLLAIAAVRDAAALPRLNRVLRGALGEDYLCVRGLFFDKTSKANWPVPWHQDLTIAVRERSDLAGWKNWTCKHGVHHVQAPPEILSRMITARLHLDDCPADNGPLRVIAGTHGQGILSRGEIRARVENEDETAICAKTGDVLLMKPLLLHASSPARAPAHRRVLHLEFAPAGLLPDGLTWAQCA